jgi:hypothetical protein
MSDKTIDKLEYPKQDDIRTEVDSKYVEVESNNIQRVSWSNKIEQNIREIGEKSKGYKIMHVHESIEISNTYKYLMIAGITLGPIAGFISGLGATIVPNSINMPITATCISFISGIVMVITKYGKFEEKSSHHKMAASKYTSLESNVRRQLLLIREDRINAVKYLEYVGSNFDELFLSSPLISKKIYDEYVKIAVKNGIIVPEEYGLTIQIDEAYQRNRLNEMNNCSRINVNDSDHDTDTNVRQSVSKSISYGSDRKKRTIPEDGSFKGTKEIKRIGNPHFSDLNKFSDGRMEYEMQRMMGLK